MSPDNWQQIGAAAFFLAAMAAIGSQAPWAYCSYETGNELGREFVSGADPDPLAQRVLTIQTEFESRNEPVPVDTWPRIQAASGVCREAHSHGDAAPFWALSVFLMVLGFFARNQGKITAEQDFKRRTARRQGQGTPLFDKPVRPQIMEPELEESMPDGIEVDDDFDLGLDNVDKEVAEQEDGDSLMDFVESRRQSAEAHNDDAEQDAGAGAERFGGFYCPRGFEDKPVLYVDTNSPAATDNAPEDQERLDNDAVPFKSLGAAMEYAGRRVVKDTAALQVRVAPGVYKGAFTVPDRCVVVNHRMPGEAPNARRLQWLMAQGLDDPDRVTILPPPDAPIAARFTSGQLQGIYGCYLVGREGVSQTGLSATSSVRLTIFNCVFEGFGKSGVRLENCGAELPGHGVMISACQFLENVAGHGGGINTKKTVLSISECMFQKNRAHSGGAIWAEEMKKPLSIRATRFSKNSAQGPEPGEIKPSNVKLRAWMKMEGLGGAVAVHKTKAKITASEFVDNQSNVAGGAFAALGSQVVMQGNDEHDVRFHRNLSRLGGAIFALGWNSATCTVKLETADVQQNRSKHSGGGICGFGMSTTQMLDTKLAHNSVEHERGLGGGVGLHNGAEFLCRESDIRENSSKGAGGGIGGINAHIKIGDEMDIRANKAAMSGGGVFAITEANDEVEELVSLHNFKLPFVLATQDCSISQNTAEDLGAGLRAGNFAARSTFPMGIKLNGKTRFRDNRTKHPNAAGDDIWIVWNGETTGSTENRPVDKMLLK